MYKLLFIWALLPTTIAAQAAPNPAVFTYDAAFGQCTQNPDATDLVSTCREILADAYILKRAVAQAFEMCTPTKLRDCALPFEDAGLPAFGIQIAADVGCDTTDFTLFSEFDPLTPEHCITFTSDILADEGAVPLDTTLDCFAIINECRELAFLQYRLWNQALINIQDGHVHGPTIRDLLARQSTGCEKTHSDPLDSERLPAAFADCMSDGIAQIWRDLSLESQG
ncbi:hypothetical protein N9O61_00715 [Octadecabacter sp.]|nr:hypothetical protein [Octadecabacter sp.]